MSSFKIPNEILLIFYIIGVYTVFLRWGFLQEKIFSRNYELSSYYGNNLEHAEISMGSKLPPTMNWNFGILINFCMAVSCFVIASLVEFLFAKRQPIKYQISPMKFILPSLSCVCASPLSYEALNYIPYPLMILTKSSKPIPVMLIGVLVFGKVYTIYKYISVLLLVLGICLFSSYSSIPHDESVVEAQSIWGSIYGICLVLTNLLLDGFTNNKQDSVFTNYRSDMEKLVQQETLDRQSQLYHTKLLKAEVKLEMDRFSPTKGKDKSINNFESESETKEPTTPSPADIPVPTLSSLTMMRYVNMWQSIFLAAYLSLTYLIAAHKAHNTNTSNTSEIYQGLLLLTCYDDILSDLLQFCVCAAVGQLFVFSLMKQFGSLVWICVSVTRKLFTILVSIYMFEHSIQPVQWWGLGLVSCGVFLDAYSSYTSTSKITSNPTNDKEMMVRGGVPMSNSNSITQGNNSNSNSITQGNNSNSNSITQGNNSNSNSITQGNNSNSNSITQGNNSNSNSITQGNNSNSKSFGSSSITSDRLGTGAEEIVEANMRTTRTRKRATASGGSPSTSNLTHRHKANAK